VAAFKLMQTTTKYTLSYRKMSTDILRLLTLSAISAIILVLSQETIVG
jgi:hypothetical protein